MNKQWFGVIFLVGLSLPATAQKNLTTALERAVIHPRPAIAVAAQAHQTNFAAYKQIAHVFSKIPQSAVLQTPVSFTPDMYRQVFQVKRGTAPGSTASAFALNIDGQIWGVTAGHVMQNIHKDPYMLVQTAAHESRVAPIEKFYIASPNQNDVALFEIPPDILPHLEILQPQTQLPPATTLTQSPCFVKGNPLYLPAEDVLFAGPYCILLRDRVHQEMNGYCGSPVLVNGKVIGLHTGFYSSENILLLDWAALLREVSSQHPPALHVASPITQAILLARSLRNPHTRVPLKVLGHTVAWLSPNDQLYSIQLLRNGLLKQTLHIHPFIHFDKLEEFFELQDGDVLRITIISPKNTSQAKSIQRWDVSVPSGQVTELL